MAKRESSVNADFKSGSDIAAEEAAKEKEQIENLKKQAEEMVQQRDPAQAAVEVLIPTDVVPLPSRGKIYPVENNLHNATEIEIRHMTASDENILTSRSLLRTGQAIDALLSNCIIDKSIDPTQLISGDKNAVMISLRVGAYGEEYKIDVTCPECEESIKDYVIDLSALTMNTLDIDPVAEGENRFEFTSPNGLVFHFKLLNSAEEKEISDMMDRMKRSTGSPMDTLVTTRHKQQIISVNGNDDKLYINRFVDSMPARDSRALANYISSIEPDIDMSHEYQCTMCNYSGEVEVPITAQFFWPE